MSSTSRQVTASPREIEVFFPEEEQEDGELPITFSALESVGDDNAPPVIVASVDTRAIRHSRAVVTVVEDGSREDEPAVPAAALRLRPGATLISVRGRSVVGQPVEQVLERVRNAARPLSLGFLESRQGSSARCDTREVRRTRLLSAKRW